VFYIKSYYWRFCAGNDTVETTTSAVLDRSHNTKTTTTLDLFAWSSSRDVNDETTLTTGVAATDERTDSSKPQPDTSAVRLGSSIYATSSWKTITTPTLNADRLPATTGNNTRATSTTSTSRGGGAVDTAPMTPFSRSGADVISLTQSAATAAATTTALSSPSRGTTIRPFEPSTTTTQHFSTDAGVRDTTDFPSESHILTPTLTHTDKNRGLGFRIRIRHCTHPNSRRSWRGLPHIFLLYTIGGHCRQMWGVYARIISHII